MTDNSTNASAAGPAREHTPHPHAHLHVGAAFMVRRLCGNWWVFVLRGLLALVLSGCVVFTSGMLPSPFLRAMALAAIMVMFAAYFFSSAILDLVAFAEGAAGARRSPFLIVDAIAGIALCAVVLRLPALEVRSLILFLGAYAVVSGSLELRIVLRSHSFFHTWLIALAGITVAILGVVLLSIYFFDVHMETQAVVNWIAATAFYTGLVRIAIGLYFRSWRGKLPA